ncbi:hypothetical protein PENTCL1PPCAC_28528, partial [Pristionchus entomophagus]
MSSHPMLSNIMHARVQRQRIESINSAIKVRTDLTIRILSQTEQPLISQQVAAAAVAPPNSSPTNRVGHHHVHHGHNTLVIGGLDT